MIDDAASSPSDPHGPGSSTEITNRVLECFSHAPDPRLREVMLALVRHLHGFAEEVQLTEAEWAYGIRFLTEVGNITTDRRQEFILLSDVLGLSMVVDAINHPVVGAATPSTVLGPFYAPEAPWRENGDSIAVDQTEGVPALYSGRVLDLDGGPIEGAVLDVWQSSANMLYPIQDPNQPQDHLRARFRVGSDGRYWFWGQRPVDYPVPHDGPVGRMLDSTGRHPWRAAHMHFIVTAPGFAPLTTHIFDSESKYLDSDAVFGVRERLICRYVAHAPGEDDGPPGPPRQWYSLEFDFVLQPL